MLPSDLQQIVDGYVADLDEYLSLPSMPAFRTLVRKSDKYVIDILGDVLSMETGGHLHYRLVSPSYVLHFNFTENQRQRMLYLLDRAISQQRHVAASVWLMVGGPMLYRYPEFAWVFSRGFFCKLIVRLQP